MDFAGGEGGVIDQAAQEGRIGLAAKQREARQRRIGAGNRLAAVGAMDDQLRQHRIERGCDRLALSDAAVDAHAGRVAAIAAPEPCRSWV